MTNQTIPADKLRALLDGEGSAADKIQAIYDDLLPPALPDPLFGARATHPRHGEGIVISQFPDEDGLVRFVVPDQVVIVDGVSFRWLNPSALTFHTPDTPDHPEFLESEEDYRSAPEGTIVARNGSPFVLNGSGWDSPHRIHISHGDMAGRRRRALRWGWEA